MPQHCTANDPLAQHGGAAGKFAFFIFLGEAPELRRPALPSRRSRRRKNAPLFAAFPFVSVEIGL